MILLNQAKTRQKISICIFNYSIQVKKHSLRSFYLGVVLSTERKAETGEKGSLSSKMIDVLQMSYKAACNECYERGIMLYDSPKEGEINFHQTFREEVIFQLLFEEQVEIISGKDHAMCLHNFLLLEKYASIIHKHILCSYFSFQRGEE